MTRRFKTSFSLESWNNVIINFHDNITFRKLKIHLLCLMRPIYKSVFNIHDPKGIKYLFQLRMNLNQLRSHKKHNFADTPSDICACNQGIEDTRHFSFECLKFPTNNKHSSYGNYGLLKIQPCMLNHFVLSESLIYWKYNIYIIYFHKTKHVGADSLVVYGRYHSLVS